MSEILFYQFLYMYKKILGLVFFVISLFSSLNSLDLFLKDEFLRLQALSYQPSCGIRSFSEEFQEDGQVKETMGNPEEMPVKICDDKIFNDNEQAVSSCLLENSDKGVSCFSGISSSSKKIRKEGTRVDSSKFFNAFNTSIKSIFFTGEDGVVFDVNLDDGAFNENLEVLKAKLQSEKSKKKFNDKLRKVRKKIAELTQLKPPAISYRFNQSPNKNSNIKKVLDLFKEKKKEY